MAEIQNNNRNGHDGLPQTKAGQLGLKTNCAVKAAAPTSQQKSPGMGPLKKDFTAEKEKL
tara:strand:+ start:28 stop:207 length:180 start_codon:yes stop_codon:yes gene_type:complete